MPLISIRLDDQLIERLKAAAEKHNVGYQTLLKTLLRQGLRSIERGADVEFSDEDRRAKRSHTIEARSSKAEVPVVAAEPKKVEKPAPVPDVPSTTLDEDEVAALFASL